MHQVLAHGHQTLDGVEWRVCKNTDGTGQPLQWRLKLHDEGRKALGNAVEGVGSVAAAGVEDIVHEPEHPSDVLPACFSNGLYLLGQPVQRRLKLHDEGRNARGNAVEGVGSVAAAGVEDIVHEPEHPSDVLPACSSNGLYLLGQGLQRIGQSESSDNMGGVEELDGLSNKCHRTIQLAKIDAQVVAVHRGTWSSSPAVGGEREALEVHENGSCLLDGVDHRVLDELNCLKIALGFHLVEGILQGPTGQACTVHGLDRFVDRSLELVKRIPLAGKALIQQVF